MVADEPGESFGRGAAGGQAGHAQRRDPGLGAGLAGDVAFHQPDPVDVREGGLAGRVGPGWCG